MYPGYLGVQKHVRLRQLDLILLQQAGTNDKGHHGILPVVLKFGHGQRHGRVGCPKQPVVLEKDAIYLDYEVVLVTLEALSQLLVHMVGQNGVACRQNGWAVLNLAPEFIPPFFEGWHSVSSFMVGSINLPFAEFTKVSCVLTRLKNATSGLNSARADEAAASAPVYSAANTPIWAPSHLGSLNN